MLKNERNKIEKKQQDIFFFKKVPTLFTLKTCNITSQYYA